MKVEILAGSMGSQLSEETTVKSKPMVEIGEQSIRRHIMKHQMAYGHTDCWASMDTMREKVMLEQIWDWGRAPWKVWT